MQRAWEAYRPPRQAIVPAWRTLEGSLTSMKQDAKFNLTMAKT